MLVKKFQGETFEEALKEVKRELGPNAIILSRKFVKDPKKGALGFLGKPLVELTAAIDRRMREPSRTNEQAQQRMQERTNSLQKMQHNMNVQNNQDVLSISPAAQSISKKKKGPIRVLNKRYVDIDDNDSIDELIHKANVGRTSQNSNINPPFSRTRTSPFRRNTVKQEISSIIKGVKKEAEPFNDEEMFQNEGEQTIARTPKNLKSMALKLSLAGVESRYIDEIVDKVSENMNPLLIKRDNYLNGYVAKLLMDKMNFSGGIQPYNHGPKLAVVMGPTGVGKTTTLSKIAASFKKQQKKVGIISLDVHKIGAVQQLKIYSNILQLPLKVVANKKELIEALSDMRDMDLIMMDTTGRSRKDQEALVELKNLLNVNIPIEKHLCISSSMRDEDVMAIYKRFSTVGIDRIIFTKLDETSIYGGVYNLMRKVDEPVAYFTSGQRVPEDIEIGSKERLVDLILKLSGN